MKDKEKEGARKFFFFFQNGIPNFRNPTEDYATGGSLIQRKKLALKSDFQKLVMVIIFKAKERPTKSFRRDGICTSKRLTIVTT